MADAGADLEMIETARPGPLRIFVGFAQIALHSFGGAAPWARRMLVDKRGWMTEQEFTDELGAGQLLPGPNIVNVAVRLGDRMAGPWGVVAALAGLVGVPTVLSVSVAAFLMQWIHMGPVHATLIGMACASAGLVWHMGFKIGLRSVRAPLDIALALATFAAVGPLHVPLVFILAVGIPLSLALHWRRA
jgi:chromate transporter